jgi:putative hydrolase of the HAD superfamily
MTDHQVQNWTIFLDIGGVILDVNEGGALAEISRLTSLPKDLLASRMAGQNLYALERGKISLKEYFRLIFKDVNSHVSITYDQFKRYWIGLLGQVTPVAAVIPTLRDQARVWLLSNTNHIHIDYIRKHRLIISNEVGYRKPDSGIYELALATSGASAKNSIFIDDRQTNLEPAKKLGFQTHHFQSVSGLLSFLRNCGLNIPVA